MVIINNINQRCFFYGITKFILIENKKLLLTKKLFELTKKIIVIFIYKIYQK